MTLIGCTADATCATTPEMDGTPWQIRMKSAGLTQRMLAQIVDRPENTISRRLRGEFGIVPGDLIAIIIAWEDMAPEQRTDWFARVREALDARRTTEDGG